MTTGLAGRARNRYSRMGMAETKEGAAYAAPSCSPARGRLAEEDHRVVVEPVRGRYFADADAEEVVGEQVGPVSRAVHQAFNRTLGRALDGRVVHRKVFAG